MKESQRAHWLSLLLLATFLGDFCSGGARSRLLEGSRLIRRVADDPVAFVDEASTESDGGGWVVS
jgi:hypothetical protein